MSWVVIDEERCTLCGLCTTRCTRCFFERGGTIQTEANEETCILCGHCVSLCPSEAITHVRLDMEAFEPVARPTNFDTAAFIQFLSERRSHRHFLKKPVPQEDLARLIEACRWAPTGSNVQNVELIVYQDPEKIRQLSNLCIDYFFWIADRVKAKVARLTAEGKQDTEEYRFTLRGLGVGERMAKDRDAGLDPIFYHAPVLVIFHSISLTSAPKDNAVLVAHTLALTARTMGLESCYIGLVEVAARYFSPLKEALALPPGHEVFDTMILGYPKMKFLKTVPRKPIQVRWE